MKKNILFIAWIAIFSLTASNSQAQSLKDLLNKDNISKVVNAITGTPETIDMTGTWTYSGSAVEFESDNLLMKAGGAAAATMAENKLNEQLTKVGIKEGQMSFTFNADSTFTSGIQLTKTGVPATDEILGDVQDIINEGLAVSGYGSVTVYVQEKPTAEINARWQITT